MACPWISSITSLTGCQAFTTRVSHVFVPIGGWHQRNCLGPVSRGCCSSLICGRYMGGRGNLASCSAPSVGTQGCPTRHLGGHRRYWNFYGSSLDGHWALVHIGPFNSEVQAVNPVTKVTIRLPRWPKPKFHCLKMFLFAELRPKVSLGGFLAVGIVQYRCLHCQCLQFARDGDEEWTPLEMPWESYNDVTFHDGKVYVVDKASNLLLCNLSGPPPLMTRIITRGGTSKSYKHLVHSSTGELLLVWKDDSWFGVARLDMSTGAEWVKVKTVGQDAILFDRRHALCISTEARPELRSSCIYFPDIVEETREVRLGVFALEGGRLEFQHLPHPPCPRSSAAYWLIPGFA
uniref:Putative F-box protein At5g55150 n=1 Tax=Anthurium amnicola TaxID=1678845 RepID=A0A1D1Z3Z8_9ARAE